MTALLRQRVGSNSTPLISHFLDDLFPITSASLEGLYAEEELAHTFAPGGTDSVLRGEGILLAPGEQYIYAASAFVSSLHALATYLTIGR